MYCFLSIKTIVLLFSAFLITILELFLREVSASLSSLDVLLRIVLIGIDDNSSLVLSEKSISINKACLKFNRTRHSDHLISFY